MSSVRAARRTASTLAAALLLAACSSGHGGSTAAAPGTVPSAAAPTVAVSSDAGADPAAASPSETAGYPTTDAAPGAAVPQVRDAFAVLQATYDDGCTTPGNCEYFLTRVLANLGDLCNSMKASPKETRHFAEPIARIHAMHDALDGDYSFPNLERHQKLLLDTREMVNTWMQSHPEDYR
ncbi:hypothetical protein [Streptomyces colonosanans]|uniref:Lipoprotein n=1 Tax=Streptomyces colonosanans TaxID=1428652 RepID=A0A1S2PMA5_9ACTN|nr:hypothetical protein [Streptomyces colonosanans]OIJ94535.1 hypothetical protein BIV24_10245 [Streptomyces colonosanans]